MRASIFPASSSGTWRLASGLRTASTPRRASHERRRPAVALVPRAGRSVARGKGPSEAIEVRSRAQGEHQSDTGKHSTRPAWRACMRPEPMTRLRPWTRPAGGRARLRARGPARLPFAHRVLRAGRRDNLRSRSASISTGLPSTQELAHETARRICWNCSARACVPSTPPAASRWRFSGPRARLVVSHKLARVAPAWVSSACPQRDPPAVRHLIVLGPILLDAPVTAYSEPLEVNPCIGCDLCVPPSSGRRDRA